MKALKLISIEGGQSAAYIRYLCTKYEKENAVIRAYGEKKNIWYCPDCKRSGQIRNLLIEAKEITWEEAKQLLTEKAIAYPSSNVRNEIPARFFCHY
jgi:type I restriction-modification system DNA methylase subunit